MPVELLVILAGVLIALPVGLWRTRHERAAARAEREAQERAQ
jgi:hypothetical protein